MKNDFIICVGEDKLYFTRDDESAAARVGFFRALEREKRKIKNMTNKKFRK